MIIAKLIIIERKSLYRTLLLMSFLVLATTVIAQKKIKLEPGSQQLVGFRKDGVNYTSVTGNVKFTHKGTVFYCDSAVLAKKTNYLEAFGHVRILDNDSVTITAHSLRYDGNTRVAKLRQNVVLTKLEQLQILMETLAFKPKREITR